METFLESVTETNGACNGLKKKKAISTDIWIIVASMASAHHGKQG